MVNSRGPGPRLRSWGWQALKVLGSAVAQTGSVMWGVPLSPPATPADRDGGPDGPHRRAQADPWGGWR
jgi:hypothetical protein